MKNYVMCETFEHFDKKYKQVEDTQYMIFLKNSI